MIIADTMVWGDFISRGDDVLMTLLDRQEVLLHPYVRGEISLGNLARRTAMLAELDALPAAPVADHDEVIALIESAGLAGSGVGFVDAHLLASTMLVPRGALWTRDKRLLVVATRLGVAFV